MVSTKTLLLKHDYRRQGKRPSNWGRVRITEKGCAQNGQATGDDEVGLGGQAPGAPSVWPIH